MLPSEDIKGRIIGKEGRNIRSFEKATGVDVELDEEGVIRLSSFDAVRREIARVSLERLMKDTRIQPVRIEEVVDQVKKELERIMFEEGEKLYGKDWVGDHPLVEAFDDLLDVLIYLHLADKFLTSNGIYDKISKLNRIYSQLKETAEELVEIIDEVELAL